MKPNHTSRRQLLLYLLGELAPGEKKAVKEHLSTCHQCQKLMEEEKRLLTIFKNQSQPQPSEMLLEKCRMHLRERIREESIVKTRGRFWTTIWEHIPSQIPTKQLVTATVVFLFGLVLGRLLPYHKTDRSLSSQEAIRALQSSMPIGHFRVVPSSERPNQVEIHFSTVQENVLRGNLQDSNIRYALSYALVKEPSDNIRLKTIGLLEEAPEDELVQKALIHTLKNDENPGVRLKAIKVLKTLPVNESIKRILISTLFKDSNAGVRKEVTDALNRMTDPKIRSILQNKAKEDKYIQALISSTKKEGPVSLRREM